MVYALRIGGLGDLFAEVSEIFRAACGVCDEVEGFGAEAGDYGIVDYAACGRVEEAGEGGVVGF